MTQNGSIETDFQHLNAKQQSIDSADRYEFKSQNCEDFEKFIWLTFDGLETKKI